MIGIREAEDGLYEVDVRRLARGQEVVFLPDAVPLDSEKVDVDGVEYGWVRGLLPAPSPHDLYLAAFFPAEAGGEKNRYLVRVVGYVDRFARAFFADGPLVAPPARYPELAFAFFKGGRADRGVVQVYGDGGSVESLAEYRRDGGGYTLFGSWYRFGARGKGLSLDEAVARSYFAFVFRARLLGEEVPGRGLSALEGFLRRRDAVTALRGVSRFLAKAEGDCALSAPASARCLYRWLHDAGLSDAWQAARGNRGQSGVTLLPQTDYSPQFCLYMDDESPIGERTVWKLESALNRYEMLVDGLGPKAARSTMGECMAADRKMRESFALQFGDDLEPEGRQGAGEWGVRAGIARAMEEALVPVRYAAAFKADVDAGTVAFEVLVPDIDMSPASAWIGDDEAGAWTGRPLIERERDARAYAQRIGLMLAGVAARQSASVRKVAVTAEWFYEAEQDQLAAILEQDGRAHSHGVHDSAPFLPPVPWGITRADAVSRGEGPTPPKPVQLRVFRVDIPSEGEGQGREGAEGPDGREDADVREGAESSEDREVGGTPVAQSGSGQEGGADADGEGPWTEDAPADPRAQSFSIHEALAAFASGVVGGSSPQRRVALHDPSADHAYSVIIDCDALRRPGVFKRAVEDPGAFFARLERLPEAFAAADITPGVFDEPDPFWLVTSRPAYDRRFDLPDLEPRKYAESSARALGCDTSEGLAINYNAPQRNIAEHVAETLAGLDSVSEGIAALRSVQDEHDDPDVWQACTRLMTGLAQGDFAMSDQNEIVDRFLGDDRFAELLKKCRLASAKGDPSADGLVGELSKLVDETMEAGVFADDETTVYRVFDSSTSRIVYNLAQTGRLRIRGLTEKAVLDNGKRVVLAPDAYLHCCVELTRQLEQRFDRFEDALRYGREAVRIAPTCSGGYRQLARAYMLGGDVAQARRLLVCALRFAVGRNEIAWLYYQLAYVEWKSGRIRTAQACYLKAIVDNPAIVEVAAGELKEMLASERLPIMTAREIEPTLSASNVPLAPTAEIMDALQDASRAAVDEGAYLAARNVLSVQLHHRPDDALVHVLRSLER